LRNKCAKVITTLVFKIFEASFLKLAYLGDNFSVGANFALKNWLLEPLGDFVTKHQVSGCPGDLKGFDFINKVTFVAKHQVALRKGSML
jgi:hypothetical protein